MRVKLQRTFHFDASHRLPCLAESDANHKCARPHGHTWRCVVVVAAEVGPPSWVGVDYYEIARAWASIDDALDHRDLNTVMDSPTTERICLWIWEHLKPALPGLCRVELYEGALDGCHYEGE